MTPHRFGSVQALQIFARVFHRLRHAVRQMIGPDERSHSEQLVSRLRVFGFDLGLCYVRHEEHCAALASGADADCRCDAQAEIGGHRYSFSDLDGDGSLSDCEPWQDEPEL